MEVKKTQLAKPASVSVQEASEKAGQWKDFFGDIKAEFNKISWTNPDELRAYTKIVVGTTFFLGMGIYIMDLIIQSILGGLHYIIHLMGG